MPAEQRCKVIAISVTPEHKQQIKDRGGSRYLRRLLDNDK